LVFLASSWILLLALHSVHSASAEESCERTSGYDVLVAALHSNYVRHGYPEVGDSVPNATQYKVIKVVSRDFIGLHLEPLKLIVTRQSCSDGELSCIPTVVVAFMGTTNPIQLINEMVDHKMHQFAVNRTLVGVMKYFWDALDILDIVNTLQVDSTTRYILTGHSLGGAMASLLALIMTQKHGGAMWKHPGTRLISFGMPRAGDQRYATMHDQLIPPFKKVRVVNDHDLIPHAVQKMFGFVHESREVWIEETKEWYWKRCPVVEWCYTWRYHNKWHVCPLEDSEKCSNTLYNLSVLDHLVGKYLTKVRDFYQHPAKVVQFEKDQCP